jgi:hypothetical protein
MCSFFARLLVLLRAPRWAESDEQQSFCLLRQRTPRILWLLFWNAAADQPLISCLCIFNWLLRRNSKNFLCFCGACIKLACSLRTDLLSLSALGRIQKIFLCPLIRESPTRTHTHSRDDLTWTWVLYYVRCGAHCMQNKQHRRTGMEYANYLWVTTHE